MLVIAAIGLSQYLVQYHENSQVEADVTIGDFKMSFYSVNDKVQHKKLLTNPDIKQVVKSKVYSTREIQLRPGSWGIDRIDSRVGVDNKYIYPESAGKSVTAYVVDTGVDITHKEFEGRAFHGIDMVNENHQDLDGHGTHVAGILGSKTYGVAKLVNIVSVKVLNATGDGDDFQIIKGMEWAVKDAKANKRKAVMNLSLGGEFSKVLNAAVAAVVSQGIHVTVAAGNDDIDACTESPGSSPSVITVGNSDRNDKKARSSSWGPCVDIFAPGENIKSTFRRSAGSKSGSSMSTPHVTGVLALYLSEGVPVKSLKKKLLDNGTKDAIIQLRPDTVNILVYNQLPK